MTIWTLSTCAFGLLSLSALHIPASLNSNCVFDLFSLSVQVSFALTSTCAFGLLSLSALHKKSGHTHAILCLPRRSALLYSHAPCRCPYTDHSASVSRMSKFIIRDLKIASCTFQNGHNEVIHKKIVQNSLSIMKKIENMIVKLDI